MNLKDTYTQVYASTTMISQFSIIVAIDHYAGIAKDGRIPWRSSADMQHFREKTMGTGKNAVIMGRVTYESIPADHRPLEKRHCVIISKTWRPQDHPEVSVYPSLLEALIGLGGSMKRYEDIYLAGGAKLYTEAIQDYIYLVKKIHVTRFKTNYDCDLFFPYDAIKNYSQALAPQTSNEYVRYTYEPKVEHQEYKYLSLLRKVIAEGENCPDRTGVGTKTLFGETLKFDISQRIPLITTKKIDPQKVIIELLWYLGGNPDTKLLEQQNVNIWKANTTKGFLEGRGLKWREGDPGPIYPFQMRHYGAEYKGCDEDYTGQGLDQLKELIKGIRAEPHSRRHVMTYWNPLQLNETALPPCHYTVQFHVSADGKFLDCMLLQRSCDLALGFPYNIAAYSILTYMIAHICQLAPRNIIHSIGNTHVYNNHLEGIQVQLQRVPRPWATLRFKNPDKLREIDDFKLQNFLITRLDATNDEDSGYTSWPHIALKLNA
jgi:dihydrofolate reductase / thymidylate synthase